MFGKDKDFWMGVLEAGLATMQAGSRPGATTLGALGEGGLTALTRAESRKRAGAREREFTRRTDISEERLDIDRVSAGRPESTIGKLAADRDAGHITDDEYQSRSDYLSRQTQPRVPAGYRFTETGELEAISGGPQDPNRPATSIAAVVAPIVAKVSRGVALTEDEQAALDLYQRLDPIDRLLRTAMGAGGASPGLAPTGSAQPDEETLLSQAREAIAAGESKPAVARELRAMGIDPSRL
jgi:hypothetical protein